MRAYSLAAIVDSPPCPRCERDGEYHLMRVFEDWDEFRIILDCPECGWVEAGESL